MNNTTASGLLIPPGSAETPLGPVGSLPGVKPCFVFALFFFPESFHVEIFSTLACIDLLFYFLFLPA